MHISMADLEKEGTLDRVHETSEQFLPAGNVRAFGSTGGGLRMLLGSLFGVARGGGAPRGCTAFMPQSAAQKVNKIL
ncbi:MAG: hypothetical protein C4292_05125 [Nitrososphaera sp.]